MWLQFVTWVVVLFQALGFVICCLATGDFLKANKAADSVVGVFATMGFLLSALFVGGAFQ